jgi:hypothetical protein
MDQWEQYTRESDLYTRPIDGAHGDAKRATAD